MTVSMVRLGDVVEINPRKDPAIKSVDEVSFVGMADISDLTFTVQSQSVRARSDVEKGYTAFKKGDVLVAKITPCFENGKLAIAEIEHQFGFGSTEFHVFRPFEHVDSRYIYHFFRQESVRVSGEKNMTGSAGQRRVPKAFFENLLIPLPPLERQREIAAVLDKVDELRAKRRQSISKLEELLQSTFLEMFGDPVENPKGWEVRKLGEALAENPKIGTIQPAKSEGTQKIVRVGEIGGWFINSKKCAYASLSSNAAEKYDLCPGDLLLARAIGSKDHLGKASLVIEENRGMTYDSHVMRIRPDSNRLLGAFLAVWLRTSGGRARFFQNAGQTAVQWNINSKQFSAIDIPLPSLDLQNEFSRAFSANNIVMKAQQRHLQELDHLYQSLQQQFFGA